jgi:CheY-like chemotaxis protein
MESSSPHLKPSVLIVEDDPTSVSALRGILTRFGRAVSHAATIHEALPMLDQRPAAIILDLMLPDCNGIRILEQIRQQGLDIPVVVVTGMNDAVHLDAVMQLRPEALLRKPVDLAMLLRALNISFP